MSLSWGSPSSPTFPVKPFPVYLSGIKYTNPPTNTESIEFSITIQGDRLDGSVLTEQQWLDELEPLYDALVNNGWTNVTLSQRAEVHRDAS